MAKLRFDIFVRWETRKERSRRSFTKQGYSLPRIRAGIGTKPVTESIHFEVSLPNAECYRSRALERAVLEGELSGDMAAGRLLK